MSTVVTEPPGRQAGPGAPLGEPSWGPYQAPTPHTRWMARNPLRVKLVAAVLVLVALALTIFGITSVYFLNRYVLERVDGQLTDLAGSVDPRRISKVTDGTYRSDLPVDFVYGLVLDSTWTPLQADPYQLPPADLPAAVTDYTVATQKMNVPFTVDGRDGRYRWRVLAVKSQNGTPVVVAQNLSNAEREVDRLVFVEVVVGLSVLAALAMAGAWMVRASLRPLTAIERTAKAIAGGDLTRRVPELDPRTELGQLSSALNSMLGQIEVAFRARAASEARAVGSEERMRQFIADASHELRTPLTTIRGFAELYRQGAATDAADVLRRIESEAARMGLLVEDLLLLARLDEERPMQFAPVDLARLVHDAAVAARAVDPDRPIEVTIEPPTPATSALPEPGVAAPRPTGSADPASGPVAAPPPPVRPVEATSTVDGESSPSYIVDGDEGRLRQVVGNLVTNALTHTPPGTPIALRLRTGDGGAAVLEVSDRGPGLTPEQSHRVFERFYRVDKARTRSAVPSNGGARALASPHNGTGLGLAIVAALVAAHHGAVEVDSQPGQGATFRVRLPLLAR